MSEEQKKLENKMTKIDKYLKQFLNVHWLRPETALWRTMDCVKMDELEFKKPIIDIGCGDGIFSFVRGGGQFGLSFDMFLSVGNLDKFSQGADIYDSFNKNNLVYDIVKKPDYKIDVGIDWKQTLLNKANFIGLYEKLIKHDVNYKLPLKDNSFNTVFSNIVYWLDNIDGALKEFSRIITDRGKIILMLPDKKIKKYYIYNEYLRNKSLWVKLLDRGRYEQMKKYYSYQEWKKLFKKAGLEIIFHDTLLSTKLIKFWDIGLRPLSPALIKMANSLGKEKRKEIKKEWIKICYDISRSFLEDELKRKDNLFHLFVLKIK